MKELYLALMDRTFDAYGADGVTVTAAMTAAAPRLSSKDFLFLPPDAEYASALAMQHGFMLY